MSTLQSSLKSPSFWTSAVAALTAVATGLTDTGNPTLIAIGAGVIAVHTIGEALLKAFIAALPSIQTVAHDVRDGNVMEAIEKTVAIVPLIEEQIVSVQNLAQKVEDNIKIADYKLKGYEVTPHVDSPTQTSTATIGGEHQVIGVPKP